MEINRLIDVVKEKITKEIILEKIDVEDKSFLHKSHKNNSPNKFHIKIIIVSNELKSKKKLKQTKNKSYQGQMLHRQRLHLPRRHGTRVSPLSHPTQDVCLEMLNR